MIEQVTGDKLKKNDLIWNGGYLWQVEETKFEVYKLMHDPEVRRWCVTCRWSGKGSNPQMPGVYTFARREDMTWPREIA